MAYFRSIKESGGGSKIAGLMSNKEQNLTLTNILGENRYTYKFKLFVLPTANVGLILGNNWEISAILWHVTYLDTTTGKMITSLYIINSSTPTSVLIPVGEWMDVELAKDYVIINGEKTTGTAASTKDSGPIYLFGLANNRYSSSIAIADFEVIDPQTGNTIMQLEARKDSETGAGYFYDKISDSNIYGNGNIPLTYVEF